MKIKAKKLAVASGVLAVSLFCASSSLAASYVDEDDFTPGGKQIVAGGSFTGNFNITSSNADGDGDTVGYTPASQFLTSAFASFTLFSDAGDVSSTVRVILDGEQLSQADYDSVQLFTIIFDDLTATGYGTLSTSGILDYTISNNGSSGVYLNNAILSADYGDKLPGNNVPDAGSTAALFGTVSVAAWALRRRFGKIA